MDRKDKIELIRAIEEKQRRRHYGKLFTYYPDTGPLRRELYKKHIAYFEAGKSYRQRLMLAANRVGKTEGVGGFELASHLTGLYPEWWNGRRFDRPVKARASGDTGKSVRDIVQEKLLGPPNDIGSGLIPQDCIIDTTAKSGIAGAIDTATIRHISGGVSRVRFQSYDQKRIAFQGDEQDIEWLDEEPPIDIYTECLMRTMTNNGMVMLTFTPLMGLSDTVMAFLPKGKIAEGADGSKFVIMATWDDVPHLSEKDKKELWDSIPPFQRDARSKGVPQLGSGAIFPIPESELVVPDFGIPDHWVRGYGMDVGWNRTAAAWHALDRETDILYMYSNHYRGQAEPSLHAEGIRSRGEWIHGAIDPASRGRSQVDGQRLFQIYTDLGLKLHSADNSVEAGIYALWQRMSSGRFKVFQSCQDWLTEYRLYRRDEKGVVIRENDHLMVSSRYFVMSGMDHMKPKPGTIKKVRSGSQGTPGSGWMGS